LNFIQPVSSLETLDSILSQMNPILLHKCFLTDRDVILSFTSKLSKSFVFHITDHKSVYISDLLHAFYVSRPSNFLWFEKFEVLCKIFEHVYILRWGVVSPPTAPKIDERRLSAF